MRGGGYPGGDRVRDQAWQPRSAGAGAKGKRLYEWALIDTRDCDLPGNHWLLIRRNLRTREMAFYLGQEFPGLVSVAV